MLISIRFLKHLAVIEGAATYIYLISSTLSHFITLTFIPYLLFYLPVALLVPRRKFLQVWASVVITLGLAVLVIDSFVFNIYRFHINGFTLELMFGGAGADIFHFHYSQYIIVISTVVIAFVLELLLFRWLFRFSTRHTFRGGKWIILAVAIMLVCSHAMHAYAMAIGYRPITRMSRSYPLYFPTTASSFLYKHGIVSPDENRVNINDAIGDDSGILNYPRSPIVADTVANSNILLILLDSWNQRTMDSQTMPHLVQFSEEALYFDNHYSGSNGTRTGVFSLFYGIPGLYWYDILGANVGAVFIDQLIRCQYQMGLFTSASLSSPPFDRTIFAKIRDLRLHTPGDEAHDRDIQITRDWLDFTENYVSSSKTEPFFGFLFYDAMHSITHPDSFQGPFQPALKYAPYERLGPDMDPTPFWNLYRNVAYFQDSLVNILLTDLRDNDLLDNTIVIITGDHGQEFNENKKGYWGHNGNYTQAQLGVPLIIHWPGMSPAVHHHWTSHYDIVPTLMQQLFHCANDIEDYSIGKSLLDTTPREWLIVGSHDNLGVIEVDRITTVYFDRSFDITDRHLNEIKGARLNSKLINEILRQTNRYYLK